jgi:predicted carbohydrate-binding protein with CBM48
VFDPVDDAIERIARHLRRPVQIDPALDGRVMREIAALPAPGRATSLGEAWRWLTRPRQLTLSPLGGGLAAALALAAVVLLSRRDSSSPASPQAESRAFQFVLIAPRATQVSLVGDFNDWDATRTLMRRVGAEALWTAVVPLAPGRYHYAFLVDGSRWLADPAAPVVRDEDYDTPSSVLTVGGGGS